MNQLWGVIMGSYESSNSVKLMGLVEEIDSFEPLIFFSRSIGAESEWESRPSNIEGLKQSGSTFTRQVTAEIFQCSYGL